MIPNNCFVFSSLSGCCFWVNIRQFTRFFLTADSFWDEQNLVKHTLVLLHFMNIPYTTYMPYFTLAWGLAGCFAGWCLMTFRSLGGLPFLGMLTNYSTGCVMNLRRRYRMDGGVAKGNVFFELLCLCLCLFAWISARYLVCVIVSVFEGLERRLGLRARWVWVVFFLILSLSSSLISFPSSPASPLFSSPFLYY